MNEEPKMRTVGKGQYSDMSSKYGQSTQWPVSSDESLYNAYVENYGPFTIYMSADDSVKIACLEGKGCFDQTDRAISQEEAAERLGVESLDQIGEK